MADDTKQILDPRERFSDPEETDRISAESTQANIFTAMPVVIKKHDHEKNAVHTQIATKLLHLNEGKPEWKEIAKNEDIPVYYPGGGGAMITFPVQDGDEGLMVFASRSIDKWWQQGGVQEQMHSRMHDVSDGFCFPGFYSQPNKVPNVNTKTLQIRTRDGKSFFEFNPATKAKGKDGKEIALRAGEVEEKPSLSMSIEAKISIGSFGGAIDVTAKADILSESSGGKVTNKGLQVVLDSPAVRLGSPNANKWIAPNVYVIAGGGGGGGGGGSGPNGETGVIVGPINLTQDVIGVGDNDIPTTVVALQHRMLSTVAPLNGQALVWDNVLQVWKPGNVISDGGDVGPPGPEGPMGPAGADSTVPGPIGPAGPQGPNWTVGTGLVLNTATDPDTITIDTAYLTGAYLPLVGGTLSGGLSFGSAFASSTTNLSRHIALFGTANGFNVTSSRLNYVGASHRFMIGAIEAVSITSTSVGILNATPQAILHVGTTAATARIYHAYTDASNGTWAYLGDWGKTSNIATYGTDFNGTGAGVARDVNFVRAGVIVLTLSNINNASVTQLSASRLSLTGTVATNTTNLILVNNSLQSSNTSTVYGFNFAATIAPTGANLTNFTAIGDTSILSGTIPIGTVYSFASQPSYNSYTGTQITTAAGYVASQPGLNAGQVANYYSFWARNTGVTATTGTVTTSGLRIEPFTAGASGTATVNLYSVNISIPSGGPSAGTNNNRGIYITGNGGIATGTGVVNNYALYSDSTAPILISSNLMWGTTASFPMLRRNATALEVKLADNTAFAPIWGSTASPSSGNNQLASTAYVDAAIGASGGGTITGVIAGAGLTGGGLTGTVTLALAPGVSGSNTRISDTAPSSPVVGDGWWDSVGGQLYIWFSDGSSNQWVPATNQPGAEGATGATGPVGPAGPTGPIGPSWTVGTGLTLTAGTVISLTIPVDITSGGTGATTPGAALANLLGAPLASPAFTGNPTAPDQTDGDSDTSIANTRFVTTAITNAPNKLITITGDVDGSGTNTINVVLNNVNPTTIGTFQGITVNAKGLVTNAVDLSYLTGNQTITLSGPITGTGTTAITTAITNASVTYGKIQNVTAARLLGNPTGVAATPSEITLGTGLSFTGSVLNVTSGNISGMTAGQIPIAASATTITSSGNLSGDVLTSNSLVTSLKTDTNANVGTFQGITVNNKGLVTNAVNQNYLTSALAASTYLPLAGGTLTGKLITLFSGTTTAGFNLPPGAAPTTPVNGDLWTTTAGLYARISGITIGPMIGGNQTITLSGDVSGSGTTAITTSIAAGAVVTAKILDANVTYGKIQNVTAVRLLGNPTGVAASPSEISLGTGLSFTGTVLNAATAPVVISGMTAGQIPIAASATTITSSGNLTGAVTTSGSLDTTLTNNVVVTAKIANSNVTYAKIQNVGASKLLGNPTGTSTVASEIVLGTGLSFSGNILNAASTGGSSVVVSDIAPGSPTDGDMWFDSIGGQLYVWYSDGTSSQWVPSVNQPGVPGPIGPSGPDWTVGTGLTLDTATEPDTIKLITPVPTSLGGTGATTPSQALLNLGGVPEAPMTGIAYGRQSSIWTQVLMVTGDVVDGGNF